MTEEKQVRLPACAFGMFRLPARLMAGLLILLVTLFSTATTAEAQRFSLSGYSFDDSAYLTQAELQEIARPFVNRSITFADVQKLVGAIQNRYAQRGIVTAKVLIEPQDVAIGGTLHLTLVEARLGQLIVTETSGTKNRLLRGKLPFAAGEKPDYEAIAETSRFFEVAHGAKYHVEFKPGSVPGTTDATIAFRTTPGLSWSSGVNNHQTDALGTVGMNNSISSFDRFDRLERLSGSLLLHRGGLTLSTNLSYPIAPAVRMSFGLESSRGSVVNGPTVVLDPESERTAAILGFTGPFGIKPDRHKFWSVSLKAERSTSRILDLDLTARDLREITAQLSTQRQWTRAALRTSYGFAIGNTDSGGASETDGRYYLLSASANYARRLSETFVLELTGRVQLAPDQNLSSLRQFSVGGTSSLVGYPHFVATGDGGFHARSKASCPGKCDFKAGKVKFSPYAFWDIGHVSLFTEAGQDQPDRDILTSLGLGLRAGFKKINVIAEVGVPLKKTEGFDATGDPAGVLSISFSF